MSRRDRSKGEEGSKVPAYIVTYSDMVTLLLTFFVMLMSLAQFQDPELYHKGRDSFLASIQIFGIGVLFGGTQRPYFGHVKVKYFIERPDKLYDGRTIDANEEEIRRVFRKIAESVDTMPSELTGAKTSFSVTDIHFGVGQWGLDESAKGLLRDLSLDFQQAPEFRSVKFYVLGLARERIGEKKQYILSARRAQVVAEFLIGTFPRGYERPVYSWGAGPGGDWILSDSTVSAESQILIAVLRSQ